MRVNINNTVYFDLTRLGIKIWQKDRDEMFELLKRHPPVEDEPPTSMQLWRFMALFGPSLHVGGESPVVDMAIWTKPRSPLEALAEALE